MEAGLAAQHPEIKTYAGVGIDDPAATMRADNDSARLPRVGPLAERRLVHRSATTTSTTASTSATTGTTSSTTARPVRRAPSPRASADRARPRRAAELADGPTSCCAPTGSRCVTDPTYATYFGPANVTAAKVTLINRVNQVYEDETAIRLVLIADTDKLNLNTAAQTTGANGPVRRGGVLHARPGRRAAAAARSPATGSWSARSSARATTTSATSRSAQRRRRRQPRRRRRQQQGAGLHRRADTGRRLLRGRLRRARDGSPVRRQPHVQRHAAQLLGRQPQRRRRRSSRAAARRSWPTPASASRTTCSRTATRTGRSAATTRSRRT